MAKQLLSCWRKRRISHVWFCSTRRCQSWSAQISGASAGAAPDSGGRSLLEIGNRGGIAKESITIYANPSTLAFWSTSFDQHCLAPQEQTERLKNLSWTVWKQFGKIRLCRGTLLAQFFLFAGYSTRVLSACPKEFLPPVRSKSASPRRARRASAF